MVQKPDDVPEQVWEDWTAHRRKKRATVTPTVLDGLRAEAAKAGLSVTEAMTVTVTNGWQGFRADWMTNGKSGSAGAAPKFGMRAVHKPEEYSKPENSWEAGAPK